MILPVSGLNRLGSISKISSVAEPSAMFSATIGSSLPEHLFRIIGPHTILIADFDLSGQYIARTWSFVNTPWSFISHWELDPDHLGNYLVVR